MKPGFAAASLTLVLLAATPAVAQGPMMFNRIGGGGKPEAPKPPTTPPPALPGAESSGRTAAPARRIPTDMEPNEALFDAINRGDMGAARDALNRGADLHAQNILGMTPLELSVDLGRNDISFMLLSMRGGDDVRAAQASSAKPQPVKQAKKVAQQRPAARVAASTPPPAQTQTARLFSGDGGTPNPNAGFLGFDSSRR